METLGALLFGTGVISIASIAVLFIAELVTVKLIREPKQQTFEHIRLAAMQNQTIFAPALGALVSGLFVSTSASFLFGAFTDETKIHDYSLAGTVTFLIGAVLLALTLQFFLKDAIEPADLAQDAFSIWAAADECAANPRKASLSPQELTARLDTFDNRMDVHSLGMRRNARPGKVQREMKRAADAQGFWRSLIPSFQRYFAAVRRYPFTFVWPFSGYVLFMLGTFWLAATVASPSSFHYWKVIGAFALVAAVVVFAYCAARGNRARKYYQMNRRALENAKTAITKAEHEAALVDDEDRNLRGLALSFEAALKALTEASKLYGELILRLGKFRLSKVK